jgi:hypothetical protein
MMNALTKSLACLLVAGVASCTSVDPEHVAVSPDQAQRYINLAEKLENSGGASVGAGKQCSIPATASLAIDLNDDDEDKYNCVNDEMDYFQLENVRSAVVRTSTP